MLYWCVLTLGPIGVAASVTLGHLALSEASATVGKGYFLSSLNIVSSFIVSWALIILMYRVIPDTRVLWRSAALGSFIAALSWEIGKWGFGLYVARVGKTSWYGTLALLPLFMLWIYITWSVVLVGLEISYVQQFWRMLKRRYLFMCGGKRRGLWGMLRSTQHENTLSDVKWVLSLGVLLCRRFKEGQAIHPDIAADHLLLPNQVTGEFFLALEQAGLIHATSRGAYTLAKPPETITAQDLFEAVRTMCQVPPDLLKDSAHSQLETAAIKEFEEREAAWASSRTLAQLAE
jgi:membrane protein